MNFNKTCDMICATPGTFIDTYEFIVRKDMSSSLYHTYWIKRALDNVVKDDWIT